ncbi:MAG: amidohydrolase family protein, partial [Mycobacteriaceae bacterium]|nr:amidohydrolase family protein [Mycobacteriaceae bacterium]
MLITADTLLTGRELLRPAWFEIEAGTVRGLGSGTAPRRADRNLGAVTVVPGFVDTHVHGGGGANFSSGSCSGASQAAAAVAAGLHLRHGTTTIVASLVAAGPDDLTRQVRELADDVGRGVIAGIHLEGPWLAAERCGAQQPSVLRDPDRDELDRLLATGAGTLKMITLAPERRGA